MGVVEVKIIGCKVEQGEYLLTAAFVLNNTALANFMVMEGRARWLSGCCTVQGLNNPLRCSACGQPVSSVTSNPYWHGFSALLEGGEELLVEAEVDALTATVIASHFLELVGLLEEAILEGSKMAPHYRVWPVVDRD